MEKVIEQNKYNLIIVAGPTASGKTKFAIDLAQEMNGVLINADSRQIYKLLDIGTNKGDFTEAGAEEILGEMYPLHQLEQTGVEISLFNFAALDENFSVSEYQKLVLSLLPQIWAKGKVPILVGGTGLYISAIIDHQKYNFSEDSFDTKFREELNQESLENLQLMVQKDNESAWTQMNNSDRQNPRRLIRAIERKRFEIEPDSRLLKSPKINSQIYYLQPEIANLTEKISTRVDAMFAEGIVLETIHALALGYQHDVRPLAGIGYADIVTYLDGEIGLEECKQRVVIAHRRYAKKQTTWFKKYLQTKSHISV